MSETETKPEIIDPNPLRLDLGSGPRPAEGFKGVDIVRGVTDFCVCLDDGSRWPFEDNSVEQLRACHFIEHIRSGNVKTGAIAIVSNGMGGEMSEYAEQDALFFFFEEAWRVAKPGATFQLQWPALQSIRAFQDPTHRRFLPIEFLMYLDKDGRKFLGVEHYNVKCDWVAEFANTTIPQILTTKDQELVVRPMLLERWNVGIDHVATLRARK